jgi:hypothetical protein
MYFAQINKTSCVATAFFNFLIWRGLDKNETYLKILIKKFKEEGYKYSSLLPLKIYLDIFEETHPHTIYYGKDKSKIDEILLKKGVCIICYKPKNVKVGHTFFLYGKEGKNYKVANLSPGVAEEVITETKLRGIMKNNKAVFLIRKKII